MTYIYGGNPYEDMLYDGQCTECKHLHPHSKDVRTCDAFPDAIPLVIFGGKTNHDVPRPDLGQAPDNDVVYEEMD